MEETMTFLECLVWAVLAVYVGWRVRHLLKKASQ